MKIIIDSNLRAEDMPDSLDNQARRELTARNPEYAKREHLGLWLGECEPYITLARADCEGRRILPRGYLERLITLAESSGVGVELDDRRVSLPPLEFPFTGELRDYQERALAVMAAHDCGVLVAPCGSGKTAMGMALIARLRQPALILVHTLDLLRQTREAAAHWLGVAPSMIGGGKTDIKPVTVATVQTLTKRPELISDLSTRFGLVLLDESQHCPASSFMDVMQRFFARYRYGLTATPRRADGLEGFMAAVIGPVRHEVGRDELARAGTLVEPDISFVPTEFSYCFDGDWTDMISALTGDAARNNLLFGVILKLARDGRRVLALTQRVNHAEAFHLEFEKRAPGVSALAIGTMKKAERAESIKRLSDGGARILFATQLADEGLDIPEIDAVVLMAPTRNEGRTIQRAGRALRALEGKRRPVIVDVADWRVPVLASQARSRFFGAYRMIAPGARLPGWLERKRRDAA
jgi:superfamily II DNA or RNA helicase